MRAIIAFLFLCAAAFAQVTATPTALSNVAGSTPTPADDTAVVEARFGAYRFAEIVADGPRVAVEVQLVFDESAGRIILMKPMFNKTSGFHMRAESGNAEIIEENETHLVFKAVKNATLVFEIEAPRKINEAVLENSVFYRKEFAVVSDNHLERITVRVEVSENFKEYRLFEFNGTWFDVTSLYNLKTDGKAAVFSFSGAEKRFRLESGERISIANTPEETPAPSDNTETPAATPEPTAYAAEATPTPKPILELPKSEKPIETAVPVFTPEPTPEPEPSVELSISLEAPGTVEAGELYNVSVVVLSTSDTKKLLLVGGKSHIVTLRANELKRIDVTLRAPEARGTYTLTASIDQVSSSRTIGIDYKPMALIVTEAKADNGVLADIVIKNRENLSTRISIVKDSGEEVYSQVIEGAKEVSIPMKLRVPGEYRITATASFGGVVVDEDEYKVQVEQASQAFDIAAIAIIASLLLVLSFSVYMKFIYKRARSDFYFPQSA